MRTNWTWWHTSLSCHKACWQWWPCYYMQHVLWKHGATEPLKVSQKGEHDLVWGSEKTQRLHQISRCRITTVWQQTGHSEIKHRRGVSIPGQLTGICGEMGQSLTCRLTAGIGSQIRAKNVGQRGSVTPICPSMASRGLACTWNTDASWVHNVI